MSKTAATQTSTPALPPDYASWLSSLKQRIQSAQQRAALAVGVDTGLTHIAAAFGRPTVELYCDSPRWKTEGNWSPCIVNLGDAGAPPDVAQAAAAALALLDRPATRSAC